MANKGKRYTDAEKQKVIDLVIQVNKDKGRGGVAAAARKFKISPLTVTAWATKAGALTTGKKTATKKVAKKRGRKPGRKATKTTKVAKSSNPFHKLAELHDEIAATKAVLANLEAEYKKLKKSV